MDTYNLKLRKEKFNNSINRSLNILEERKNFNLDLRKEKLENHILKKRLIFYKSSLEIQIEKVQNIPEEIKIQFIDKSNLNLIKKNLLILLKSNYIHYIKYSLVKLRCLFEDLQEKTKEIIDNELVDTLVCILVSKKDYSVIYETLCCLKYCVIFKNQDINSRILGYDVLQVYENLFNKYFMGSYFDDLINSIIILLGNIIIDNEKAKVILIENFTIINKISDLVQNLNDEIRIDLVKNSVWFFSNLIRANIVPEKVSCLSLNIFCNYTDMKYLSRLNLVCTYNLPIQDQLTNINNIKKTITDSFAGIYFIVLMRDQKLVELIIKHNLIIKINDYGLDHFDEYDISLVIQIFINVLSMDIEGFFEVIIDEKRKF